jgi:GNAT superfamily N-acetyltransferase
VDKLIAQGVAFFVVRHDGAAAGCGGVQLYGSEYGELKRMYMRADYRGLGLAKQLLEHLAGYARSHGIMLLRLETGIHQHAAIGLYEQMGFQACSAFGATAKTPSAGSTRRG